MEMLSSFRGDKHEFCLVVIKLSMIAVAKALTSLYMTVCSQQINPEKTI